MNGVVSLIGLPLLTSPLVYILGRKFIAEIRIQQFASAVLILMWIVLGAVAQDLANSRYVLNAIALNIDAVSLLFITLTLFLASVVIIFSTEDVAGEIGEEKYYAMLLLLTGTMIGLVCSNDLFNMWVWYEGMAISSYLLVSFYRHRATALGACIKYFIQTVSASILALFGIGLIFLQTGSLDFDVISHEPSLLTTVAGSLLVMGFGVKAALVPSYTWLPDAYAEAPIGVSAFLSGIVTLTGLFALLKALSVVMWSTTAWGTLLIIIGLANIVIGNLLALPQTEVKRILAYSSVSHIGYIVLAIGIGIYTLTETGMRGGMLHLFIHGIMKALAFLAIGAFVYSKRNQGSKPITIEDLAGTCKRYPGIALALTLALLSLAGVPPLAGFISKLQILLAGLKETPTWIIVAVGFAAINSVFSLAYYLPIINALYFAPESTQWDNPPSLPMTMRLPILILAAFVIILGLFPGLVSGLIDPAAQALLRLFMP